MNITKKAISVGISAALLASLVATVAAPAAFAGASVTNAGNILLPTSGNTSTSAPVTFTFTENAVNSWTSAGSITVSVVDANGSGAGITLGGTLVPQGPGYMGVTASVSGNTLTVTTSGPGQNNLLESIGVSGVTITVGSGVATGALSAKVTAATGGLTLGTFESSTTVSTVTGTLATAYPVGSTSLLVNVTSPVSGACGNFRVTSYSSAISGLAASSANGGTVTFTVGSTAGVLPGDSVTVSGNTNNPSVNGTWTIATVPNGTTFTVVNTGISSFVTNNNNGTAAYQTGSQLTFGSTTDPQTITAVAGSGTTVQTLTVGGTTVAHQSGETVSQTLASSCTIAPSLPYTIGSPATVVGAAYFSPVTPVVVQPNENNQGPTNSIVLNEPYAGFIAAGTSLTFTLAPAGAQFSYSPSVTFGGGFSSSTTACVINAARTACTFTVPSASTSTAGTITFTGFDLDVAGLANSASITFTGSGVAIYNNGPVIATSALLVVASAATPTVYIGFNDQPSGQISITEGAAGFFSSSPSLNNTIGICLTSSSDTFTRAPWAVVTTGDLKLAAGSPIAPATQAAGTLFTAGGDSCAYWTVYSASTVASTIQIRGTDASGNVLAAGATNGVNLSIAPNAQPGTVQAQIYAGTYSGVTGQTATVTDGLVGIAVRAFKNQPVVAALSQPMIAPGTSRALLGNLTITETQAGQFKQNEIICVSIVPLNIPEKYNYQAAFVTTNYTADQPVIMTNNTTTTPNGLLVSPVSVVNSHYFCVTVNQQATGALGQITISNMVVYTPTDATAGPVLVTVTGGFGAYDDQTDSYAAGQAFQQTVSNAVIGSLQKVVISASGSGGTAYSLTSQVLKAGQKITVVFKTNPQLAGTKLNVWLEVRAKGATKFGALKPHASVVTDVNGVAMYQYTASAGVKVGFVAQYVGDATHAAAFSYPTIFAAFTK